MNKSSTIRRYAVWFCFALGLIAIVPLNSYASVMKPLRIQETDEREWSEFHADAYEEYADEFTALFNSYEVKRSKNGRTMIRQGDSGSFKFVKSA